MPSSTGSIGRPTMRSGAGALELVEHPVVVGAHAGEAELAVVFDVGEDRARRIDDADVDAVFVHVGDVRLAVVVAGQDLVEAQARELLVVASARPAVASMPKLRLGGLPSKLQPSPPSAPRIIFGARSLVLRRARGRTRAAAR